MEEWKDIPGYEGLYQISDHGNVRNNNKVLRYNMRGCYRQTTLSKNGVYKYFTIHRLVALVFLPNPDNFPQVDHIDRDTFNNHISNLRWVSRSQNQENRGMQSNNKLGEQHICLDRNRYKVNIKRDGILTQKCFKTLDEAKDFRDSLLN